MSVFGARVTSGDLRAGRHYAVELVAGANVGGQTFVAELEGRNLGFSVVDGVGGMAIAPDGARYRHRFFVLVAGDRSLVSLLSAVAGAANRSGSPSMVDPMADVRVWDVNEDEFAAARSPLQPLRVGAQAATQAVTGAAAAAQSALERAGQSFAGIGQSLSVIAWGVPIALGLVAAGFVYFAVRKGGR